MGEFIQGVAMLFMALSFVVMPEVCWQLFIQRNFEAFKDVLFTTFVMASSFITMLSYGSR